MPKASESPTREFRSQYGNLRVLAVKPSRYDSGGGHWKEKPGVTVDFIDGAFTTNDPVIVDALRNGRGFGTLYHELQAKS